MGAPCREIIRVRSSQRRRRSFVLADFRGAGRSAHIASGRDGLSVGLGLPDRAVGRSPTSDSRPWPVSVGADSTSTCQPQRTRESEGPVTSPT